MKTWRIGVAGLGVVGSGLLQLLAGRQGGLAETGARLELAAVSARNRDRDRGVPLDRVAWHDDPVALAAAPDIDIFVELIGGADGPARAAVEAAIAAGKHVVTANKALIAAHGRALAEAAEEAGVALLFEAAVAAGVPVIRALREGAAACHVDYVAGVLNGTCNYILTQMDRRGVSYDEALAEAQRLGYAEADPALDVSGADAAHKLAILSAIAFGAQPDVAQMSVTGVEKVAPEDVRHARTLGYRIKLLAVGRRAGDGVELRVGPALVNERHPVARTVGSENILYIKGDPLGVLCLTGPGAGAGPTASAVAADILAIARGAGGPVYNRPAATLAPAKIVDRAVQTARYYMRFSLKDVPGAIAATTETLAEEDVSIDSLLQPPVGEHPGEEAAAAVVITTHAALAKNVRRAGVAIAAEEFVIGAPALIRIEDF